MAVRPIDANAMLNELRPVSFESEHSAMLLSDVSKMMREWVERQPTLTPPNEWVSIKERLPGAWKEVLIFSEPYVDVGYLLETGDFYSIRGFNNITHWMPLPAAPDSRPPEGEI